MFGLEPTSTVNKNPYGASYGDNDGYVDKMKYATAVKKASGGKTPIKYGKTYYGPSSKSKANAWASWNKQHGISRYLFQQLELRQANHIR